jgi:signal peptidase
MHWKSALVRAAACAFLCIYLRLGLGYPFVAVMSDSMAPGFVRGDFLLTIPIWSSPPSINDIVVFQVPQYPIPIVHRIVAIRRASDSGEPEFLTRGDANIDDDTAIYGQDWLKMGNLRARVRGIFPYIGLPSVLIGEMSAAGRLGVYAAVCCMLLR